MLGRMAICYTCWVGQPLGGTAAWLVLGHPWQLLRAGETVSFAWHAPQICELACDTLGQICVLGGFLEQHVYKGSPPPTATHLSHG